MMAILRRFIEGPVAAKTAPHYSVHQRLATTCRTLRPDAAGLSRNPDRPENSLPPQLLVETGLEVFHDFPGSHAIEIGQGLVGRFAINPAGI